MGDVRLRGLGVPQNTLRPEKAGSGETSVPWKSWVVAPTAGLLIAISLVAEPFQPTGNELKCAIYNRGPLYNIIVLRNPKK